MLKQRLEATENALLRLLLVADETTITAAFSNSSDFMGEATCLPSTNVHDMPGSVEVKKAALATHWDQFPLRTAEEVKCWAREVLRSPMVPSTEKSRGVDGVALPEPESNQPVDASDIYSQAMLMTSDNGTSGSGLLMSDMDRGETGRPSTSGPKAMLSNVNQQPQQFAELEHISTSTSSILQYQEDEESLELSQEFRQQYLW